MSSVRHVRLWAVLCAVVRVSCVSQVGCQCISHSIFGGVLSVGAVRCLRLRPVRGGACTFLYPPMWLNLNMRVFRVVVGWSARSVGSPIILSIFGAPHRLRFVSSRVRFLLTGCSVIFSGVEFVGYVGCGLGLVYFGRVCGFLALRVVCRFFGFGIVFWGRLSSSVWLSGSVRPGVSFAGLGSSVRVLSTCVRACPSVVVCLLMWHAILPSVAHVNLPWSGTWVVVLLFLLNWHAIRPKVDH